MPGKSKKEVVGLCKLIKFDLANGDLYFQILPHDFKFASVCVMNLGRLEQVKKRIEENILTYEAKDFISILKNIDAVAVKFVVDGDISVP